MLVIIEMRVAAMALYKLTTWMTVKVRLEVIFINHI